MKLRDTYEIDMQSVLPGATPAAVWAHATSWRGVNAELAPLNMTHPPAFPNVTDIPADGKVHFTSTLRLGWLPLDRHRLALRALSPGEFFDERSSNLMLRQWTHRRSLHSDGACTVVRDQCTLTPRVPMLGPLLAAVYRWVFRRRHGRLRAAFAQGA